MVKVKKRASKRLGVAQREKVKKKVREHHRKQRKEAKKNPQWKSKIKKDPGIPNSFPYKEQMLNEIEATKRRQEEEKIALREAKRAERISLEGKGKHVTQDDEEVQADDLEVDGDEVDEAVEDDFADLPMTAPLYRGSLTELLRSAEVKTIVITLDARDPQSFRCPRLEKQIKQARPTKNLVIALGRADMVPSENLALWTAHLSSICMAPVFPIASLPDQLGQATGAQQLVDSLLTKGKAKGDIAVLGLAYSGRSTVADAILNAIGSPDDEDDADWPAVLDTPALVPQKVSEAAEQSDEEEIEDDDEEELNDDHKLMLKLELKSMQTLMRNQGHVQRIKEPLPLARALLSRVSHPEDLMLIYNVPAYGSFQVEKASLADQELEEEEKERLAASKQREKVHADAEEFLIALARASGRMKKRNMPDPVGASRVLLRDWSHQMLGYYTQAPKLAPAASVTESAKAKVAALSPTIVLPRKEWRKKYQARELRLKPISSILGRDALVLDEVEMMAPPLEDESDADVDLDEEEIEVEDATLAQDEDFESEDESDDAAPLPKSILKNANKKRTTQQRQEDPDDDIVDAVQPSRKERRGANKKARISVPAKSRSNGTSKPSVSAGAARAASAATGPAPGEGYDFGAFF